MNYEKPFNTHSEWLESLIDNALLDIKRGADIIYIDLYDEDDVDIIETAVRVLLYQSPHVELYIRVNKLN